MRFGLFVFLTVLVALGPAVAPAVHATPGQGFLSTRGTSVVDFYGQPIILRGVNYPGYEQNFWHHDPQLHNQYAYYEFTHLGLNVVRLPISWANLEPQPGVFDTSYLKSFVDQDVQWAKAARVYIILDMHQYDWADKFGGDGAPDWSVQGYPPNELGLRQAVSRFWNDTDLQEHLLSVWTKLAQHYANEPTIAGYDILNEPWIYNSIIPTLNASRIDDFYLKAIHAIRLADDSHLIFLEPANLNTFKLPTTANIVWSPHFYQLSFTSKYYPQNFTILESDFEAKYKTFVQGLDAPMWIGEFGAFMPDKLSRMTWAQDALKLFTAYNIGWAWWAFDGRTQLPTPLYSTAQ
jgi:endoglycosylceramidase